MASSIDGRDFQTALGRILTEPELNERFTADPTAVGAELGLDREQVAALEAAGIGKLRAFSHNLSSKRVGLLKKVCPATFTLLERGDRLRELTGRFVRRHPPVESPEFPSRTIRDGAWFLADLAELEREGRLGDPLLAEIARFESVVLEVTTSPAALESAAAFSELASRTELESTELLEMRPTRGAHARVETFSVDVLAVARALAEEREPGEPPQRETIVLFSKLPGWRNVRYAIVNRRTRDLLTACDGTSTAGDIVRRLLAEGSFVDDDPSAFTAGCLQLLRQLEGLNAISFAGSPT